MCNTLLNQLGTFSGQFSCLENLLIMDSQQSSKYIVTLGMALCHKAPPTHETNDIINNDNETLLHTQLT